MSSCPVASRYWALTNSAQVGIAAYKAEISVSLLLQMRDRALTAYNELRNMNV